MATIIIISERGGSADTCYFLSGEGVSIISSIG